MKISPYPNIKKNNWLTRTFCRYLTCMMKVAFSGDLTFCLKITT